MVTQENDVRKSRKCTKHDNTIKMSCIVYIKLIISNLPNSKILAQQLKYI